MEIVFVNLTTFGNYMTNNSERSYLTPCAVILWKSDIEGKLGTMKPLLSSAWLAPVHTRSYKHRLISEQQLFEWQHIRSFNSEEESHKIVIPWNAQKKWLSYSFWHRKYFSPFICLTLCSLSVWYVIQGDANKEWMSASLLGNLL